MPKKLLLTVMIRAQAFLALYLFISPTVFHDGFREYHHSCDDNSDVRHILCLSRERFAKFNCKTPTLTTISSQSALVAYVIRVINSLEATASIRIIPWLQRRYQFWQESVPRDSPANFRGVTLQRKLWNSISSEAQEWWPSVLGLHRGHHRRHSEETGKLWKTKSALRYIWSDTIHGVLVHLKLQNFIPDTEAPRLARLSRRVIWTQRNASICPILQYNCPSSAPLQGVFDSIDGGRFPCEAYVESEIQNAFNEGYTGTVAISILLV